jgi:kumamolisin
MHKSSLVLLLAVTSCLNASVSKAEPKIVGSSTDSVTLTGNTPAVLESALPLEKCNQDQRLTVALGLKLRNVEKLDRLLEDLGNPQSSRYQQCLTTREFTKLFAISRREQEQVMSHLLLSGLKIKATYPNRLLLVAEGNIRQISKAFGVVIRNYLWRGRKYYCNEADPVVPKYVADVVESIAGLNSFSQYECHSSIQTASATAAPPSAPPSPSPAAASQSRALTPQKIATCYNFPNSLNARARRVYSGKNRTIALISIHACDMKQVEFFWKDNNITRTGSVTVKPVNGTPTVNSKSFETTLDLEEMGAQVPGADIVLYLGQSSSLTTFEMAYNQVITDAKQADACSVSWSLCERLSGSAHLNTHNNLFKAAAAKGIAVFAASGDNGAYDCTDATGKGKLAVGCPSSDPNVTAVGGTRLLLNPDFTRKAEVAWSGSGGGVSDVWPQPAWQKSPGVPANQKRATADVSLASDPNAGYSTYFQGRWIVMGGTSFAAPIWATIKILADEAAGRRIANFNSLLYRIGNSSDYNTIFYDVVQGSNGNSQGPGYQAGPGWDPPTGLGTPDATRLVEKLVDLTSNT